MINVNKEVKKYKDGKGGYIVEKYYVNPEDIKFDWITEDSTIEYNPITQNIKKNP